MKIAIFTDTYKPQINGVITHLENLTQELRKQGHTVYIYAPKIKKYRDLDKFVIRIPSLKILASESDVRIPIFLPDKALIKLFSLDFDLIHAFGNGPFSILGLQIAKLKGVPFVMSFDTLFTEYTHYILNGKILKPKMVAYVLKIFANVCNGIIAPSEKMKQKLKDYGVKKKIEIIPYFINIDKFMVASKNFLHTKLSIPAGEKILLSVGRLGKEKNFGFLIKVLAEVQKVDNKIHLVIVGQGVEKKNLERLISNLHLKNNVHLAGRIDPKDMHLVFADAEVFVFSSSTETQGLVVLEAAASGLPIVIVKDKAYENIVYDAGNGFVLPLKTNQFSEKILKLLKDPDLRKRMGMRSRNIVQENFDKDKIVDSLLSFYQDVLQNYQPKAKALREIFGKIDRFLTT